MYICVYIGLTRVVADDDGDVLLQHLRLGENIQGARLGDCFLHDIAITNIVLCKAYKRGVRRGLYIAQ